MSADSQDPPRGQLTWSLTAAIAFYLLWVLLLFLTQVVLVFVAAFLTSIRLGISFDAAVADFEKSEGDPSIAVLAAGSTLLTWFATFALVRVFLASRSRAEILDAVGVKPPVPRWSLAAAIPAGVALLFVGNIMAQLLRVSEEPTSLDLFFNTVEGALAIGFVAVIIAPAAEEVFFRGFLLPPMARRFSAGTAMALNGAIFGLVHLLTYGIEDRGLIPPIFLLGFCLAGLRLWTGSVWPAIIAHLVFNGTSIVLFLAAPEITP